MGENGLKKHWIKENKKQLGSKAVITTAQTACIMAILTIFSKLLGFIREMIMAGCFGTSYVVDAYVMAQSIPSMLLGGVFVAVATSYIPLLSKRIEGKGQNEGNKFTSQVINILFFASAISALIGVFFSEELTGIMARGFTGETARLTSYFLKITLSYVMFSSTAGILEAYLQYKNVFIPQIMIGYTQNIIVIGTIIFSAQFGYKYLAFGLLIAYMVRVLLMWRKANINNFKYSFECKKIKEVTKQIAILALPVFIGSSVSQINLFVDKYLASGLSEGSVAALNYANLLNNMVMTLSITILTTIIYPRLSQAKAIGDKQRFNTLVEKGFNLIVVISVPCSLGAMLYYEQIVQIIFERGAFDIAATDLTGSAYFYYSIGLVFLSINEFFTRVYYSMHDMKTPMAFAGVGVIINIALNLLLVGRMGHNGLALATSVAAFGNMMLLWIGLKIKYEHIAFIKNKKKLFLMILGAILSILISYGIYISLIAIIWMPRVIYLCIVATAAALLYAFFLHCFKIEEIKQVTSMLKSPK